MGVFPLMREREVAQRIGAVSKTCDTSSLWATLASAVVGS